MSDDPLIYPGDMQRNDPIRRRPEEQVEHELGVDRSQELGQDEAPGGAEGGEQSRSADAIVDVPGEPGPFGDTDQHSDAENLPPHRERANEGRGEQENGRRG